MISIKPAAISADVVADSAICSVAVSCNIPPPQHDIDGNPVYPSLLPISMIWQAAGHVGALPNGRVRGQALCDGGLNPQAEYDHSGSWARLNSALKID